MLTHAPGRVCALRLTVSTLLALLAWPAFLHAQQLQPASLIHKVSGANDRLEMTVNTSRILTLDKRIPQVQVNNPEILGVTLLGESEVQISAKKSGVTQVNLWDEAEGIHTVNVVIFGDASELEAILQSQFPKGAIRARALASSVLISGFVDDANQVNTITAIAEDYFPKVISQIQVGGVQQVLLNVKVMEVSRTKLRAMGFDWTNFSSNDFFASGVAGTLGAFSSASGTAVGSGTETMQFGIVDPNNSFFGFLELLKQNDLTKVLAEPKLVAVSGRPATFNSGGEFPILVPQSLGTVSIQYKKFGTQVDFVPIVLGNGRIHLEVRPRISEIDSSRGVTANGVNVPGLTVREVETAVEMEAGQTLALAGLTQTRVEGGNRGVPWVSDLPWVGAAFRREQMRENEIELLVLVTPQFIDGMDAHEVPQGGPGTSTTVPSDVELYWRGHIEVPKCCGGQGCSSCQGQGVGGESIMPAPAPSSGEVWLHDDAGLPSASATQFDGTPGSTSAGGTSARFQRLPGATPAATSTSSLNSGTSSRNGLRNPPSLQVRRSGSSISGQPGMIGPTGYEVSN